jgi:hypothetical protein
MPYPLLPGLWKSASHGTGKLLPLDVRNPSRCVSVFIFKTEKLCICFITKLSCRMLALTVWDKYTSIQTSQNVR